MMLKSFNTSALRSRSRPAHKLMDQAFQRPFPGCKQDLGRLEAAKEIE